VGDSLFWAFFDLSGDFGFSFADCSGAGVGLSGISEIGAGSRCAVTKSKAATSNEREVRHKVDIIMAVIIQQCRDALRCCTRTIRVSRRR
jgi:hypothetical protein